VQVIDTLKHAPRWAWWTVGGVAVGGAAIKVWQGRAKPEGEDGSADPTATGGAVSVGGGAPGAGVIVPPVIIPASDDGSSNLVPLMDLFTGGIQSVQQGWESVVGASLSVDDAYANVYGPAVNMIPQLIDQAANAGSPPPPGNIIINVPPNKPTNKPAPAKPSNAPIPGKCPPAFPHRDSGTKKCFKLCDHDECKSKKKYRVHKRCYRDGHTKETSRQKIGKC
jgi:hypothetical protein